MATAFAPDVDIVRHFNRFYTRQIGVLQEKLLHSPFSLTEVRVLYEIGHHDHQPGAGRRGGGPTAAEIAKTLELDGGYLSRILQRFAKRRLITRTTSDTDARQAHLALTARGRETLAPLEQLARDEVETMLGRLNATDRRRVVEAMRTIESCLGGDPVASAAAVPADADADTDADADADARAMAAAPPRAPASARVAPPAPASGEPFTLREHRVGDLGWIVSRQSLLYAEEYRWNIDYEALAAEIVAHFVKHFDPARERCWIAERGGEAVGAVMLVKQSDDVAKLRLLHVERAARGLGIGRRLVDECVRFARAAGYRTVTLWTQSNLHAARRIYKAAGFRLVAEEPKAAFGHDLVSETWELTL